MRLSDTEMDCVVQNLVAIQCPKADLGVCVCVYSPREREREGERLAVSMD